MALQIIPKEAAKLPLWQNILFYFTIGLVLSIMASSGVLYYFTKRATDDVKRIEDSIQQSKTPQMLSLEEELEIFRDRVDDFGSIIKNHKFISNFFGNFELKTGILEKDTHPQVLFVEIDLNTDKNTVRLVGVTENLEIVGQQVNLLQDDEMVKSVELSEAKITDEGKIKFTLNVAVDPKLLRPLE